jgi:L-fuconolactonase
MREERIHSQHHLWKYSPKDYPWMMDGMDSIRRDFLMGDLQEMGHFATRDGRSAESAWRTMAG